MEKHYLAKEGREITIEEIAKELKVTKEDIALAMESVAPVESIEKNIFGDEENKLSLIDKISTGKNEEEIITNKIVVKELINKLDKKEKEVIMLRFYKEKTQSQVAKILGITQVQVSRIERRILNSMKLKLTS
ncbi:rNA polymerase sigma factor [Clostridium sp. CAG:440]|nr:rNA polymerase sigma factor [Clostridium sp. CAG:440]HJJ16012.1 sigma-70 family RNA polymerase sigma factor [Clostridiaceae bacterium]